MLKRSVVNRSVELAMEHFARHGLHLPPFAFWTPRDWEARPADAAWAM